jgi:hypothetical protein
MAVEDTRVLGGPDQEFRRSPLPQATEAWRQNEVGSLGPTTGEDDVLRPGTDETGHLFAGMLDLGSRGATLGMDRRGISRKLQRAQYDLGDLGPQGRSRVMIEICALAGRHSYLEPHEILAIDPGCRAKAPQPHLSDVSPVAKQPGGK